MRSLPRPPPTLEYHARTTTPTLSPSPSMHLDQRHLSLQKTATLKLQDQGTPECPLTDGHIQQYRAKHGYTEYDPETGKSYASRARSNWAAWARFRNALRVLCLAGALPRSKP